MAKLVLRTSGCFWLDAAVRSSTAWSRMLHQRPGGCSALAPVEKPIAAAATQLA
jgi:hypothetical protein